MGVKDFFVTAGIGVCDIGMYVMDMNNVLMDLMKLIVVRELN